MAYTVVVGTGARPEYGYEGTVALSVDYHYGQVQVAALSADEIMVCYQALDNAFTWPMQNRNGPIRCRMVM